VSEAAGSGGLQAAGLPAEGGPPVTTIEHRGIEHVPQESRWGSPSGLFWMWAGAVWNVEFLIYGTLAVLVFGLSFAQAVVIILIGNLFYVLTGLASLQGPRAGTTTFAISRAPFGRGGNRMPSFFNWVTQVGFEIEGIALVVFVGIG
jgi:purine-cytosine permease-like protein